MANRSERLMHFDTIIFGSGLSGLSCARLLARNGKKVCVIERAEHLGGHLLPFERSGVHFEVGLHYISDTGPQSQFATACDAIGVSFPTVFLDNAFEEIRKENCTPFNFFYPRERFFEHMIERFPAEKAAILRHENVLKLLWTFANDLTFPLRTKDILKKIITSPDRLQLLSLSRRTLDSYLRNDLKVSKELYEILAVQHVLIGCAPKNVSALIFLLVHGYYLQNPCFIAGGGREMINQLLHADVTYFTNENASIKNLPPELKSDIRSKESDKFRFLVQTSKGNFKCKDIVWTPDPRLLSKATDFSLPTLTRFRLRHTSTPHALTVGYFATKKPLEEYQLFNRNYWLMGTLDSNSCYDHFDLENLAENAPLYISTGSLRDPFAVEKQNKLKANGVFQAMFLCPADASLWEVNNLETYRVPESKGGTGRAYRLKKEKILSLLEERLCKEFPSLKNDLVWKELGTPLTHARYLNSLSMGGYGFSPTVFDSLIGRPSYNSGIKGLYFCGAHIKPAHGIVTSLLNGVGLGRMIADEP